MYLTFRDNSTKNIFKPLFKKKRVGFVYGIVQKEKKNGTKENMVFSEVLEQKTDKSLLFAVKKCFKKPVLLTSKTQF